MRRLLTSAAAGTRTSGMFGPFDGQKEGHVRAPTIILVLISSLALGACQSAGSGALTWQSVADVSAFDTATVNAVMAGGPGFVAVGNISESGHRVAASWTSADGRTWTRGPVDPQLTDRLFLDVARLGSNFLAVGYSCFNTGECSGADIWTSPDGLSWSLSSTVSEDFRLQGLAADSSKVVVVADSIGTPGTTFQSSDAKTWTQAAPTPATGQPIMGAIAFGGPGLVDVGSDDAGSSVWTSADGAAWSQVATGSALGTGEMRDVASSTSLLVSVGRAGGDASTWASKDGRSWTRASASPALTGSTMNRVAPAGSQFIATGKDSAGGAIWSSTDGLAWTKAALGTTAGAEYGPIAASTSTVVAFGVDASQHVTILNATAPH